MQMYATGSSAGCRVVGIDGKTMKINLFVTMHVHCPVDVHVLV